MKIILKIGEYCDKAWNWLVWSSANEGQVSSTVKYGFLTTGTLLTIVFGFSHLQFPTDQWTAISDNVIGVLQDIGVMVGAIGTLVSAIRKIYLTIKGQHISLGSQANNL